MDNKLMGLVVRYGSSSPDVSALYMWRKHTQFFFQLKSVVNWVNYAYLFFFHCPANVQLAVAALLRGQQSCMPKGASVAGAKLLLEHQQVAQGREWLHLAPSHNFLFPHLPSVLPVAAFFSLISSSSITPFSHLLHLLPAPARSVPSSLPCNTLHFLSYLLSHSFSFIHYTKGCFIHLSLRRLLPYPLLTNCSHIAWQQSKTRYSTDPFLFLLGCVAHNLNTFLQTKIFKSPSKCSWLEKKIMWILYNAAGSTTRARICFKEIVLDLYRMSHDPELGVCVLKVNQACYVIYYISY